MAQPMGIGVLGSRNVVYKRKFRWNLTLVFSCGGIVYSFSAPNVLTGGRPKINIEMTEVHYLGGKFRVPNQQVDYESLQFSFYDLTGPDIDTDLAVLYTWLASFMRLANPRSGYTPTAEIYATVILQMLDGCGESVETWTLENCWPSEVDFGELNMGDSEPAMINMTLVYNLATLQLNCSDAIIPVCCGTY